MALAPSTSLRGAPTCWRLRVRWRTQGHGEPFFAALRILREPIAHDSNRRALASDLRPRPCDEAVPPIGRGFAVSAYFPYGQSLYPYRADHGLRACVENQPRGTAGPSTLPPPSRRGFLSLHPIPLAQAPQRRHSPVPFRDPHARIGQDPMRLGNQHSPRPPLRRGFLCRGAKALLLARLAVPCATMSD